MRLNAVTTPSLDFTTAPSNSTARTAAIEFAREIAAAWAAELGQRLLGAYLLGSLAHGGFSWRYSDIDLALIFEDAPNSAVFEKMRTAAATGSPELASKLSLFWTDRGFSVGRFPPLDRTDYIDHTKALVERVRLSPVRPSLKEIKLYLQGAPFENWARTAEHFACLG